MFLLRVTLYPWMSPFWVSGGGVLQDTSRLEGDAADTLMDCGATDGAAKAGAVLLNCARAAGAEYRKQTRCVQPL